MIATPNVMPKQSTLTVRREPTRLAWSTSTGDAPRNGTRTR